MKVSGIHQVLDRRLVVQDHLGFFDAFAFSI
jgi:hypothetical protein